MADVKRKEAIMFIGLDIGGTKIEICMLDKQGNIHSKERIATPKDYLTFVSEVTRLIFKLEKAAGEKCKVGIGLPGVISPTTGLVKNANCTFLNGKDLKSDLDNILMRSVNIANDANCFALSEAVDGAAKHGNVVFGAILGTGCGGGIVFNKQVWNGPNALAGEWGHNPLPGYHIDNDGRKRDCHCGRQNCIEQFISGTGFENTYKNLTGNSLSASKIMELVAINDQHATNSYLQLIDQMARSFSSIINLLDPDIIVLGGGLSNIDAIYKDLPYATSQYLITDDPHVTFSKAMFGDSSGIRGAAWLSLLDKY
jgi:fructokinase